MLLPDTHMLLLSNQFVGNYSQLGLYCRFSVVHEADNHEGQLGLLDVGYSRSDLRVRDTCNLLPACTIVSDWVVHERELRCPKGVPASHTVASSSILCCGARCTVGRFLRILWSGSVQRCSWQRALFRNVREVNVAALGIGNHQ